MYNRLKSMRIFILFFSILSLLSFGSCGRGDFCCRKLYDPHDEYKCCCFDIYWNETLLNDPEKPRFICKEYKGCHYGWHCGRSE